MPYLLTYRGEFSNTLSGADNAAADQVVRIDINKGTPSESTSITGNVIGISTIINVGVPRLSPVRSLAERIAFWQTYADFFYVGMTVRVTGTTADGDYVITGQTLIPPTNAFSDDPGSITMTVNTTHGTPDSGRTDILFEDVTPATIIPLKLAGDPLHIVTVDNDEDKFTTVRAKQAVIKIHTDSDININTFCEGGDEDFYVEIFVDGLIIFRGFLIAPDMLQEFMPDPNILTLTANDNLGNLKDIELVNDVEDAPQSDHSIIKYIAWCLRKTGILQNINIINSVRHGNGSVIINVVFTHSGDNTVIVVTNADAENFYIGEVVSITGSVSNNVTVSIISIEVVDAFFKKLVTSGTFTSEGPVDITAQDYSSTIPFYEAVYIDAKTFEKGIGSLEDCRTVLAKILGEDCFLFQQNGEWYILRIDDMQGEAPYSVDRFDSEGVSIDIITLDRLKNIGKPDIMQWMGDDCKIIPDRAYKEVKETYRYETPSEIICNIDFSQGDFIEDLTDVTEDGALYNAKSYDLEGWILGRFARLDPTPIASTTTAYIKRLFQFGYEKQRYAAIGFSSAATPYEYIRSCPIPINKNDKFSFSVDFKFSANTGGDDIPVAGYLLYGDDGNVYEWVDAGVWNDMTAFIAGNPALDNIAIASSQFNYAGGDKTKWNTFSSNMLPAPSGGILYIYLWANYPVSGGFVFYQNINFVYSPFINGSYQKYSGQYHSITQTFKNKALRDSQVYISDSPSLLFKGALKIFNGVDRYILAKGFTDSNHATAVPFGELQAFAVWNQYRKSNRNFDGEVDLMESEIVDTGLYNGADLLHKYKMTDTNINTNNRLFMVLHYDMDFNLLEWKMFIASLYRTDEGKIYTDEHVFKFISS